MRHTKIICTLGPATQNDTCIRALIEAGMDCARLNFSHGSHQDHQEVAERVRRVSVQAQKPVAILADLCGPKIRIGAFKNGKIKLEAGARFVLTTDKVEGDQTRVSVGYKALPRDVQPGDAIMIDDGLIKLSVEKTSENEVTTKVITGGELSNRKGVNLPGAKISAPALTEKDKRDLAFALDTLEVDYVALSFVRSPSDVVEVKSLAGDVPVIAKIEKPEAVDALEGIVEAADGVMVARGDLGVEMGAAKIPLIQKRIITAANQQGKLVITATQMLDSMIRNPSPTRAEAADVANAVLDGTDAVMLSGETAVGAYPIQSIEMMDAIVREVESEHLETLSRTYSDLRLSEDWHFPNAAAQAAALLSTRLSVRAVVVFTQDGRSAGLVAEHRPRAPIVAITADIRVARRLRLTWGVMPRLEVSPESLDETLRIATSLLVREKLCTRGDAFVMVVGWPTSGRTNTVKLHRL